jgi:hypothetical protein
MVKYYFISYTWRRIGNPDWTFSNLVTDKHPLRWAAHVNKEYGKNETYILIGWQEISKEDYEQYIDLIG